LGFLHYPVSFALFIAQLFSRARWIKEEVDASIVVVGE
jgi:hypothetical protein